jgi:hypothetical protein
MASDTKSHLGKIDWFWEILETTPEAEFGLEKIASSQGVDNFTAIQTALMETSEMDLIPYVSTQITTPIVEEIANVFFNNHSMIPFVGRSLRSEQPIYCIEGSLEDMQGKFAQWENGAIYSLKNDAGKGVYILFMNSQTVRTYGYPSVEQIIEEMTS